MIARKMERSRITTTDIRGVVSSLKDELFGLAQDLVRTPSVTGSEDKAQTTLAARLGGWGLDVDLWRIARSDIAGHRAFCDDGLPVERLNLVARWGDAPKDPGDKAALVLNGHIDVVPPGERHLWSTDPFGAGIDRGRLSGRGACDMKGGLAACCLAIRAAMKLGIEPRRPILLQSVVGEETGGIGTLAAIERGYRAEAAVIAEPTSLHLCPVQAGALSFRLRVPGKAAHGAMRESGVSAVEKFWPVWHRLQQLEADRHDRFHHPLYDPDRLTAPLSVGKLDSGNWPSTVPEALMAEGRFGIFPGEDCPEARDLFEQAVASVGLDDPWLKDHPVEVEWFEGQFESGETPLNAPILQSLTETHREILGGDPQTHGVSYGSDLRLFTRYAGMPAVLYGPGDVALAHAANEWLPLDELVAATEVYTRLIARALS